MTATAPPRALPHPWDLTPDQCRGVACVWCRAVLWEAIPAGTTSVTHTHGKTVRVVSFDVASCPPCSRTEETTQ